MPASSPNSLLKEAVPSFNTVLSSRELCSLLQCLFFHLSFAWIVPISSSWYNILITLFSPLLSTNNIICFHWCKYGTYCLYWNVEPIPSRILFPVKYGNELDMTDHSRTSCYSIKSPFFPLLCSFSYSYTIKIYVVRSRSGWVLCNFKQRPHIGYGETREPNVLLQSPGNIQKVLTLDMFSTLGKQHKYEIGKALKYTEILKIIR